MSALSDVADELYALPLDAFTARRNERARGIRSSDRALATEVGALPKPTTAAWVVNAMARHMSDELGQLLALGSSLREAQASLDRDSLRALTRQRRQLVAALARQAGDVAESLGYSPSASVLEEVELTLQAALADEDASAAVRSGRLLRSLSADGLSVDLEGAVAVPEFLPGATRDDVAERRRRKAEADADDAQRRSDDAAARLDDLEERLDALSARRDTLADEVDDLRARLRDAERDLDAVGRESEEVAGERDAAATAAQKARREARAARRRLDDLD